MLSLGFAELLLVMPVSVCDAFPVTRMLTLMLVLLMLMLHCIGFPVSLLVLGIALATSVCYHMAMIALLFPYVLSLNVTRMLILMLLVLMVKLHGTFRFVL